MSSKKGIAKQDLEIFFFVKAYTFSNSQNPSIHSRTQLTGWLYEGYFIQISISQKQPNVLEVNGDIFLFKKL